MSAILELASVSQRAVMEKVLNKHYAALACEGVTIDLLFASPPVDKNGEPTDQPAITVGGYPADGCCSVTPYKYRVKGCADVEIQVDVDWWHMATEAERVALLDHELHHIELQYDKEGALKYDDLGRPKIKMRKHDREFGWFDAVAKRNGKNSHEVQQARSLLAPELREVYQLEMDFGKAKPKTASSGGSKAASRSSSK